VRSHAKASTTGSTRRHGRRSLAGVLSALALLLGLVPSASAVMTRAPLGFSPITGAGTGVTISSSSGVAVEEASGNVFLNDYGTNLINIFGGDGGVPSGVASPYQIAGLNFAGEPNGVAVDNSATSPSKGTLYVTLAGASQVKKYVRNGATELYEEAGDLTPTSGPGWGYPQGVTVDSKGNVFVSDGESQSVVKFSPTGTQLARIVTAGTLSGGEWPSALAVDSAGDLFVAGRFLHNVYKYTANGSGEIELSPGLEPEFATQVVASSGVVGGGYGVAVNRASNELFVGIRPGFEPAYVTQYDATTLTPQLEFGEGSLPGLSEPTRIAVDSATDRVYVSDGQNIVVFGAAAKLAGLTASPATGITPLAATLNGSVNPDGLAVTECKFEYGTTTEYGSVKPCEGAIPTDSSDHAVSGALSGLTPGETYHFRLAATNAEGTNKSLDQTFTTPNPARTEAATAVAGTKATLNGVVSPEGSPVSECKFEYGTSTAYGSVKPCAEAIPTDNGEHPVTAALTHLAPNGTTYHFRIAIVGGSGTVQGRDKTFTTTDTVITTPASAIGSTAATLNGTLNPEEIPYSGCEFEYGTTRDYGSSIPCAESPASIGAGNAPVTVHADLSGLSIGTIYHFRLAGTNVDGTARGANQSFNTTGPPLVETTGAPVRTTTTAQLSGRVDPFGAPASYHFEYGTSTAYGQSTPSQPAGSGEVFELVGEEITGLQPDTTYHYRLVADNGHSAGPALGEDMTVTTPASDAPLSHGHFPGPPGSDRAWEQVNAPDMGGNPLYRGASFSDNGNRAVYVVSGGTPDSAAGSFQSQFLAERTASGWQIDPADYPRRDQLAGGAYLPPSGPTDLSSLFVTNFDFGGSAIFNFWRVTPGSQPASLFDPVGPSNAAVWSVGSERSTRAVVAFGSNSETVDPAYPGASVATNFYDVSSGSPRLLSILPDGSIPPCGVRTSKGFLYGYTTGTNRSGTINWISPDGNFVYFPSVGSGGGNCFFESRLYVRDIAAEESKLVSLLPGGSTLSGPACSAALLQSNDEDAFFYTQSRLVVEDSAPAGCSGGGNPPDGDVYRYHLADGGLECVTCVVPGVDSDVNVATDSTGVTRIAVAKDGSRVYFNSPHSLVPGAPAVSGDGSTYRVDVGSGEVRWIGQGFFIGDEILGSGGAGGAISRDGSVALFRSAAPSLNPLGGTPRNGGTPQYYRYDDRDGSLVCVSCPQDGSLPSAGVNATLSTGEGAGNNTGPLDAAGDAFFATPTALLPADQNTAAAGQNPAAGIDIYEWRDGRLLLVTDGLSEWSAVTDPRLQGVSPSGRDVFISAHGALTPDAIDSDRRLYDARIGGGFDFPAPPPPCPLEACQGTPKGAPEESRPASTDFAGAGNVAEPRPARCRKGKVRRRGRCVAKRNHKRVKHHKRADHDRRAAR
jgi:NHL repeat-containing protein